MEARRAFVGEKSYKQAWIVLAALVAAAMLAIGAAFVTSGAIGTKAPADVHPAPGSVLRQDSPAYAPAYSTQVQDLDRESNPGNQPAGKQHKVTVF